MHRRPMQAGFPRGLPKPTMHVLVAAFGNELRGLASPYCDSSNRSFPSALERAFPHQRITSPVILRSVRQRVKKDIDPDRVSGGGELIEVPVIVAFTFERVTEVGIVRHEDDHASLRIADGACVRQGTIGAALRRAAAAALPEPDRR